MLFAATAAELAGAAVTARAVRAGSLEPLTSVRAPLDVLCQQLVGLACADEQSADEAFLLISRAAPMAELSRADFDACLAFLSGRLPGPAGASEPHGIGNPRWTAPRLWWRDVAFGLRSPRVARWFWRNVGTITSEESVRVLANGIEVGTLEAAYAERLQRGDRFVLDGRPLEFRRLEGWALHAADAGGNPGLPRWISDRQSLSAELAREVAQLRVDAAERLAAGAGVLSAWLAETYELPPNAVGVLADLFVAQERQSEIPGRGVVLIEESPDPRGWSYAFHAPLARAACEALGRGCAARLGRSLGRDMTLAVADLGWSVRLPGAARLDRHDVTALLDPQDFETDVVDGLDRGDLLARRFRHVASTALMVLRNPEGGRRRVGGSLWVSQRLYPMVKMMCPDHPLLRETHREVLDNLLDTAGALAWLARRPAVRFRRLEAPSPFTAAWIDPAGPEPLAYEAPDAALRRLHQRLLAVSCEL
jgi:ATP-dependent Lhr-like helicase